MPVIYTDNNADNSYSELKETRDALAASNTHHRNLIDYMQNGYAYCRVIFEEGVPVDFIHEEVNSGYEKMTGLKNVVGKRATEVFPGINNTFPEFIEKHITVAQTGISNRFELYLEPLRSWFDLTVYCPQKGYFVSIIDDITQRKIAEEAQKESEERFRKLFENHSAPMLIIDPETGYIVDANNASAIFYGWSIDELRQMHMQQISTLSPDKIKAEMAKSVLKTQNQFSFRHRKADGSLREVDIFSNAIEIHGKILLYSIIHDISERKRYESLTAFRLRLLEMAETHSAEELLLAAMDKKEEDQSFNRLFNVFPQPMLLLDPDGGIILANNAFKTQLNNHSEITPGSNIFDSISIELALEQRNVIAEVLFTGERIFYEKESHGRIYRHTVYPIPNSDGEITKLLMFIMDITNLILTEKELLVERVRYRNLFNNHLNGFAYCRMIFKDNCPVDFIPEVVNLNFKRLTGLQIIEGQSISMHIPGISISNPELFEKVGRVSLNGIAERFDLYINTLDKWLDITAYSHQKGYFVIVLTPMKTINTGNWEWNLENGEMIWSDKLRMLYGLDLHSSNPSYQTWLQAIVPMERINTEKTMRDAIHNENTFETIYNICDQNGTVRQMMTHGFPVKDENGLVKRYMGVSIDITEYKNDDTTHLINTHNFTSLLNSAVEPLCSLAIDGTILDANKDFLDIYSLESKSVIGQNFHSLFPRQLQEERKTKFELIFYTREPVHFKDLFHSNLHETDRNEEYIYHISAYPIYGINEDINSIAVFITDSNKNNKAEKSRRQLDKQYQTLIAASPDSIITTDLDGIISSVSDIGLEIFGANNKADVIGMSFSNIVYSDNIKIINEIFDVTLREGLIQNKEIVLKKKNNTVYSAEISAALIQDYNGAPSSYMMIIRDISQRKIIESELFHAKRLISLGEMASGIAHEIYQPINNIGLIVDKILMDASKHNWACEKEIKIKSEKIFENILRIQTIIDNIRSFSSTDNNYISSVININKSIRNALLMVSEQCKHKSIILDFKAEEERFSVTGNIYKFEQVILNLIKNSIDALEEKKQIYNTGFEMKIFVRSFYKNNSIIVTVEDNGIGVSESNIEYIMHPFYTTKESGKGTGLGLSISYGIIKEMNGDIKIKSVPMNGTCIIITLPSNSN
ncbi:PAS domain-containing protein [Pelodictyon phaeoclathratiforme]|jgi:PAS domain S-box-containing protein|uniref:histidine kinase n=1 Tax=Pelodictyon phaeoclathratiforme (strain DSM 5477 / BU-1) TaxID=324925 RepID=B4SBH7_PELPB|nr:PAS domain S-box protein [Pelodictyon phaeoclathratiforme]ACF44031.1 PAS/PAC sensor signal transduction histidine kinase [Pelodictyon phaeoclathratiforme BU-1]MBV5288289.1 PAS domain S-box protein [Pelodictyon phaeoclathratiforme]